MNGFAVLLTMAVVGIDYGWQPTRDGQLEYIIQIEPNLLDSLKNGQDIVSEIRPEARNVRRFRIHVGTGTVPRTTSNQMRSDGVGAVGGLASQPVPDLSPGPYARGGSATADGMRDGVPVLNLPPPPWTAGERDQLHSVLIRNGDPRSAENGLARPGSGGSVTDTSIGGPQSILPDSSTGSYSPESSSPKQNSVPPPSSNTFPAYPGSLGSYGPARPADGPPPSRYDGSAPLPNPSGTLGPPSSGQPASSTNDEILPNRPVSAPGAAGFQIPIRDPSASSGAGMQNGTVVSAATQAKSNAAKKGTHSKLMDLVRRNSAPKENQPSRDGQVASLTGSNEASSKPVIDSETADKLMQEPKPWMPLVLTSLGLFASLAANVYLAWIAIGTYRRYRHVVTQLRDATAAAI